MIEQKTAEKTPASPTSDGDGKKSRFSRPVRIAGFLRRAFQPVRSTVAAHPRRTGLLLAAVSTVALVVLVIFGVLLLTSSRRADAQADAQAAAGRTATTLLSYDYRTVDQDLTPRTDVLTGRFKDEYAHLFQTSVIPTAKANQVVTRATVAHSAVADAPTNDHVVVIVFLAQESQAGGNPKPVSVSSRVQMTLDKIDGKWMTSAFDPV